MSLFSEDPADYCRDPDFDGAQGKQAMDITRAGANPKQAFGDVKVPLHLNPPAAQAYMAIGLREGAAKYGAWNYRETNIELMTYIGAILRHCAAIVDGEWIDPDPILMPDGTEITDLPKKPHLAGILASAAILADQWEAASVIDNRPKGGRGNDTLKHFQRRSAYQIGETHVQKQT